MERASAEADSRGPTVVRMGKFERDGVVLAYDDNGVAERPPVVLLHGLSSARSTWAPMTAGLTPQHRVVAPDHRGHGDSTHATGTYTLDNYGPDTIAFCEQVVGGPAVLVGHSLGGVIAAYVARNRPDLVRAVFLEDPPLFYGEPGQQSDSPFPMLFTMLRQILGDMQARNAPLEEYEAMLQGTPAMNGQGTFAEVLGQDGTRAQAKSFARLDPEIHDEQPDRFLADFLEFIDGLPDA
jgi:pimeloyl-ACP methyl ester carboxylesterase